MNFLILSVPVTENSGTLKFSVIIHSQGKLFSYAAMATTKDGVTRKDIIGILYEDVNILTLNVPDVAAEATVPVSGIAPASSQITLYVDGVEQETVWASKAGNWTGTVTIDAPVDYNSYVIQASCTSNDTTMQKTAETTYRVDEAAMTDFVMYYNEHDVIKSCNLMNTAETKPKVYFLPGTQFDFEVEFDHPEQINKLYVTSTRNNEVKYLEAFYDESKGAFVTDGFFDENDHNYVPGVLSIEYTKHVQSVNVDSEYDWSIFNEQVSVRTDETVQFTELTDTDAYAQIDLGSVYSDLQDVIIDTSISVYDEATDGNLGDWLGVFEDLDTFASYVVPGYNDEQYLLSLDYSDPYTYVMLVRDVSGSKYIKLTLDLADQAVDNLDTAWTLTQVSSVLSTTNTVAGILLKQHEIETDMDALRDEVWSTSYATPEQRQQALKMVDELEKDQSYFALITTILPLIVASAPLAAGATMAAPAILFTGILGMITAMAPIFWEMRTAQIKGGNFRVNFVVDPSGYVYDVNTLERIEGVKTTAYYIAYDESEDFWTTPPAATEFGELWNAAEYDQENPLYTNSDGKYAWNVPEGWWRVKYEKEGYETTWSEWLPVPPPQTEVNIGMTPIESGADYTATFKGANISLDGDIAVNFHTVLSEDVLNDPDARMQFIFEGEIYEIPLSEARTTVSNGETRYVFTFRVPAKCMACDITAQMYVSAGAVGESLTYSVRTYCDNMIGKYGTNSSYATLMNLMRAMLNYGASSQVQLNHETGNLANANMTAADQVLPSNADVKEAVADCAHSVNGSESGITAAGATLVLESNTVVRYYFQLTGSKTIDEYSFTVNGVELEPRVDNSYYVVEVTDIAAKELDNFYTVSVGGLSVTYSPMSYVRSKLNSSSTTEALANVVKALYVYNQMANTYFG